MQLYRAWMANQKHNGGNFREAEFGSLSAF